MQWRLPAGEPSGSLAGRRHLPCFSPTARLNHTALLSYHGPLAYHSPLGSGLAFSTWAVLPLPPSRHLALSGTIFASASCGRFCEAGYLEKLLPMLERYRRIRAFSASLAAPLSPEDCTLQSMDEASPIRWHLAHTTWFFETFVLKEFPGYPQFSSAFERLFNSYYNTVGEQFPRAQRGLLSRPSQAEVLNYRAHVDAHVIKLLKNGDLSTEKQTVLEVGLHHEQQHQELMLTDIKHAFSMNPLHPAYAPASGRIASRAAGGAGVAVGAASGAANYQSTAKSASQHSSDWIDGPSGIVQIGHADSGFAFDNERPRHRVYLEPFRLARRCVTNAEYLQFIEAGGYEQPQWWLSLGWNFVQQLKLTAPLYWHKTQSGWHQFTLAGMQPMDFDEPVCHVSFFEADAFARWAGCRLPTEAEWEACVANCLPNDAASDGVPLHGYWSDRLLNDGNCPQPQSTKGDTDVSDLENACGNVWEWTASPYTSYPGFKTLAGALGEYNGKFMCNQFVLRGGSCATPADHLRITYRNFFPPETRWQFAGIRLAQAPGRQ